MRFYFRFMNVFKAIKDSISSWGWLKVVYQAVRKRRWDLALRLRGVEASKVSIPVPFSAKYYNIGPFLLRVWKDPRMAHPAPIRLLKRGA